MNKKRLSKIVAWLGAAISTLAASNSFGKLSSVFGMVGSGLAALAVSLASETSAGHPDGKNSQPQAGK